MSLPPVELQTRLNQDGVTEIFDPFRAKYVILTPEEYVRANFTAWLTNQLGYPASHIANEICIELNGTRRRCDTVVYNHVAEPLMIIEYKAPTVKIDQRVFDQIVRYNMVLHAKYLIVSNGLRHYCCVMDYARNTYHFLPGIPAYNGALNQY